MFCIFETLLCTKRNNKSRLVYHRSREEELFFYFYFFATKNISPEILKLIEMKYEECVQKSVVNVMVEIYERVNVIENQKKTLNRNV